MPLFLLLFFKSGCMQSIEPPFPLVRMCLKNTLLNRREIFKISKSLRVAYVRKQNSNKRELNSAEQKDHWLRATDLLFTRLFKLTSGSLQSDPAASPLDHANSFLLVMHVLIWRSCADCCALINISVAEGIRRVF